MKQKLIKLGSFIAKPLRKLKDVGGEWRDGPSWLKYIGIALPCVVLLLVIWGAFMSREPKMFSVKERAFATMPEGREELVVGAAITATFINVADIIIHKDGSLLAGGYLSNDILSPAIWLDNVPNWEYGALIQVRDLAKAMRESFSRSQSQSIEDKDLAFAEARFNFDHSRWILPQTEKVYREGIGYMRGYLERLTDEQDQNAQFFARADNLNYWLKTVETRLGSLSQRLSASVGQRRVNTDLAGESAAKQSTSAPSELEVKTPWLKVDDEFYRARGSAWALLHFLYAIEMDFADVLEKKNARVSLQQIIRELEGALQPVNSFMILNGSGYGIFANHSLVMANYISRANAAIIDLRELLSQG